MQPDEICFLPAHELVRHIRARELSAAEVMDAHIAQIERVNPVVNALRSNGIEVAAIHSHMLNEQPRLFFMHFWANDDAIKLAKGLRAAIDKTASTTN